MANKNNRTVFRRGEEWVNKRNGAERAASKHTTQKAAQEAAKAMIQNAGGGELTTKGRNGIIVSKDTIAPGNDPRSIKDTEH